MESGSLLTGIHKRRGFGFVKSSLNGLFTLLSIPLPKSEGLSLIEEINVLCVVSEAKAPDAKGKRDRAELA